MLPVIALLLELMAIGAIIYIVRGKRNPVRRVEHEYFNRLWLWPPGSHTRWEAELDQSTPEADSRVGFHAETTHDEVDLESPTDNEVVFCESWMSNLDDLFLLTKPAIEKAWKDWIEEEMPSNWRHVFSLDGFSVPKDGDPMNVWSVTYFCKPAGRYFNIEIRGGKPTLESVDG
ncbi:hypothetical protein G4Y73_00140 [Wenzhouxiangella sp. XN201]|uniref:hypothetical protein n=1 Tax=Wenzhouxiangella sp. XN201 TaxID=2710755 RepID=UPI0013C801BA|nr:hypothetical protein [Wenzhouxiangella sp. XN201]NEZ02552.1 hypothetical protein [Wenzhouxiangella sp. XN201]